MSVNYHRYLRSPEWQVVRRLAHERAAGRCQVCNQPGRLDVHHRTYERLGHELLSDVTVLCRDCHAKHHDKLPAPPVPALAVVAESYDDSEPLPMTAAERADLDRIADESFGLRRSAELKDGVEHECARCGWLSWCADSAVHNCDRQLAKAPVDRPEFWARKKVA